MTPMANERLPSEDQFPDLDTMRREIFENSQRPMQTVTSTAPGITVRYAEEVPDVVQMRARLLADQERPAESPESVTGQSALDYVASLPENIARQSMAIGDAGMSMLGGITSQAAAAIAGVGKTYYDLLSKGSIDPKAADEVAAKAAQYAGYSPQTPEAQDLLEKMDSAIKTATGSDMGIDPMLGVAARQFHPVPGSGTVLGQHALSALTPAVDAYSAGTLPFMPSPSMYAVKPTGKGGWPMNANPMLKTVKDDGYLPEPLSWMGKTLPTPMHTFQSLQDWWATELTPEQQKGYHIPDWAGHDPEVQANWATEYAQSVGAKPPKQVAPDEETIYDWWGRVKSKGETEEVLNRTLRELFPNKDPYGAEHTPAETKQAYDIAARETKVPMPLEHYAIDKAFNGWIGGPFLNWVQRQLGTGIETDPVLGQIDYKKWTPVSLSQQGYLTPPHQRMLEEARAYHPDLPENSPVGKVTAVSDIGKEAEREMDSLIAGHNYPDAYSPEEMEASEKFRSFNNPQYSLNGDYHNFFQPFLNRVYDGLMNGELKPENLPNLSMSRVFQMLYDDYMKVEGVRLENTKHHDAYKKKAFSEFKGDTYDKFDDGSKVLLMGPQYALDHPEDFRRNLSIDTKELDHCIAQSGHHTGNPAYEGHSYQPLVEPHSDEIPAKASYSRAMAPSAEFPKGATTYMRAVVRGENTLASLRSPDGTPQASIQLENVGTKGDGTPIYAVTQIQGMQDQSVQPKYWPHLQKWLNDLDKNGQLMTVNTGSSGLDNVGGLIDLKTQGNSSDFNINDPMWDAKAWRENFRDLEGHINNLKVNGIDTVPELLQSEIGRFVTPEDLNGFIEDFDPDWKPPLVAPPSGEASYTELKDYSERLKRKSRNPGANLAVPDWWTDEQKKAVHDAEDVRRTKLSKEAADYELAADQKQMETMYDIASDFHPGFFDPEFLPRDKARSLRYEMEQAAHEGRWTPNEIATELGLKNPEGWPELMEEFVKLPITDTERQKLAAILTSYGSEDALHENFNTYLLNLHDSPATPWSYDTIKDFYHKWSKMMGLYEGPPTLEMAKGGRVRRFAVGGHATHEVVSSAPGITVRYAAPDDTDLMALELAQQQPQETGYGSDVPQVGPDGDIVRAKPTAEQQMYLDALNNPSVMDRIMGAGEAAMSTAFALPATLAGAAGYGYGKLTDQDPKKTEAEWARQLSYQPTTPVGQHYDEALKKAMEALDPTMGWGVKRTGDLHHVPGSGTVLGQQALEATRPVIDTYASGAMPFMPSPSMYAVKPNIKGIWSLGGQDPGKPYPGMEEAKTTGSLPQPIHSLGKNIISERITPETVGAWLNTLPPEKQQEFIQIRQQNPHISATELVLEFARTEKIEPPKKEVPTKVLYNHWINNQDLDVVDAVEAAHRQLGGSPRDVGSMSVDELKEAVDKYLADNRMTSVMEQRELDKAGNKWIAGPGLNYIQRQMGTGVETDPVLNYMERYHEDGFNPLDLEGYRPIRRHADSLSRARDAHQGNLPAQSPVGTVTAKTPLAQKAEHYLDELITPRIDDDSGRSETYYKFDADRTGEVLRPMLNRLFEALKTGELKVSNLSNVAVSRLLDMMYRDHKKMQELKGADAKKYSSYKQKLLESWTGPSYDYPDGSKMLIMTPEYANKDIKGFSRNIAIDCKDLDHCVAHSGHHTGNQTYSTATYQPIVEPHTGEIPAKANYTRIQAPNAEYPYGATEYMERVKKGDQSLASLRSPKGTAEATAELNNEGGGEFSINQIQGYHDGPVKPEYAKKFVQWMNHEDSKGLLFDVDRSLWGVGNVGEAIDLLKIAQGENLMLGENQMFDYAGFRNLLHDIGGPMSNEADTVSQIIKPLGRFATLEDLENFTQQHYKTSVTVREPNLSDLSTVKVDDLDQYIGRLAKVRDQHYQRWTRTIDPKPQVLDDLDRKISDLVRVKDQVEVLEIAKLGKEVFGREIPENVKGEAWRQISQAMGILRSVEEGGVPLESLMSQFPQFTRIFLTASDIPLTPFKKSRMFDIMTKFSDSAFDRADDAHRLNRMIWDNSRNNPAFLPAMKKFVKAWNDTFRINQPEPPPQGHAEGGLIVSQDLPTTILENKVGDPKAAEVVNLDLAQLALMNQPKRMAEGGSVADEQPWYERALPMEGRSTFLPIKESNPELGNSVFNEKSWALPGVVAGAVNAFTAPGRAVTGSDPNFNPEEEAANFALNTAGGGLGLSKAAPAPKGALGMFVNPERVGVTPKQIESAEKLLAEGMHPQAIWDKYPLAKTPWGNWVAEIPDSGKGFKMLNPMEDTIGKAIRHTELFSRYPEIADMKFGLKDLGPNVYAKADETGLYVNPHHVASNEARMKRELARELQILVQQREPTWPKTPLFTDSQAQMAYNRRDKSEKTRAGDYPFTNFSFRWGGKHKPEEVLKETGKTLPDSLSKYTSSFPPVELAKGGKVEPTEAQKKAGNYKKHHTTFNGLNISVENPVGSTRSGKDPTGKPWAVKMSAHYGYVKGTEGADGDHVDVYLHPTPDPQAPVFVFDQHNPKGKFDEHKAVLGVPHQKHAEQIYDAHFSDGSGPKRRKAVTAMSPAAFKMWAESKHAKKPAQKFQPPKHTGSDTVSFANDLDSMRHALALQKG